MPIITTDTDYINITNYKTITHTLTSTHIYTNIHCTTQIQNDTPKGRVEATSNQESYSKCLRNIMTEINDPPIKTEKAYFHRAYILASRNLNK